jgi:uncharacterized protein (DUF2249 family)
MMKTSSSPQPDAETLFDVRPIPCRVKHAQIFQRWIDLPVGNHFVLLNDHDPIPLRYQFDAEFGGAFTWEYLERGPDDFRVKITKTATVAVPSVRSSSPTTTFGGSSQAGKDLQVDARGLEPPEPLVRILDALEKLPSGGTLHARTDREPCHLFGEAEQRGYRYECRAQTDGSWLTTLTHA